MYMRRSMLFPRRFATTLAMLTVVACGGDSSTSPKSLDVTGTWSGAQGGVGITMTIAQSGAP